MDPTQAQLQQQMQTPAFTFTDPNNKFRRDVPPPQPTPMVTMNGNEMTTPRTETSAAPTGVWTTPTSQRPRSRPATIHEGFSFCVGEECHGLPSWDSSSIMTMPTPSDTMSRPVSMHQDFYPVTTMDSRESIWAGTESALTYGAEPWGAKPCEDQLEFAALDGDMSIGQAYTADEAIPILDLRYPGSQMDNDHHPSLEPGLKPRRMSGSSFTMSTTDMASYDDFSAALSEAPSFSDYPTHSNRNSMMSSTSSDWTAYSNRNSMMSSTSSDYPPPSNRNSMMSSSSSDYPPPSNRNSMIQSTQLSPVASPRMTPQSRSELVRTQSRGRGASPSPRPGMMRSAPYSMDSGSRSQRWSTGSYGANANRRPSPFMYHHPHDPFGGRMASQHSSPTVSNNANPVPLNYGNLQAAQQFPFLISQPPAFRNSMILPTQLPSQVPSNGFHPEQHHHFEAPPPLLSHGLFRMLQSNADPHTLHGHYTDLSDPPDLYASLQEEQCPPPPEDMNPSDPDMVPHEQELRFEGDLYTPRWVRGHGNKREGWCGICKPGRWLVLKNSAFWYDKSFTHGISAATGNPFQEPQETRRMDGNPDVWEGLCGSCNEWIALVSSKKKGTTWFRHAYKCHTHPKVKDAPKRRRESSHSRALAASQVAKPKESAAVTPRPPSAGRASLATTPTPVPPPMPMNLLQQPMMHAEQSQQQQKISPPLDGMSNMI
ncbi:hypothetical protein GGR56DRAFT_259220 [Xylariaceae sp. FL0804]|nr:hypothetical protein GGR56DRAFT_259220 [Xylariaceae sp. FL0804]